MEDVKSVLIKLAWTKGEDKVLEIAKQNMISFRGEMGTYNIMDLTIDTPLCIYNLQVNLQRRLYLKQLYDSWYIRAFLRYKRDIKNVIENRTRMLCEVKSYFISMRALIQFRDISGQSNDILFCIQKFLTRISVKNYDGFYSSSSVVV